MEKRTQNGVKSRLARPFSGIGVILAVLGVPGRVPGGSCGGPGRSFAHLGRPWGALWCRLDPQDHANLALSSLLRIMLERRPTKFGFGNLRALIFQGICIVLGGQNACKSVPQKCENRRSDTVPKRLNVHSVFRANVTIRTSVGKASGTTKITVLWGLA